MRMLEAESRSLLERWILLWTSQETNEASLLCQELLQNAVGVMWVDDVHVKLFENVRVNFRKLLDTGNNLVN
jgi:hypothetical protein